MGYLIFTSIDVGPFKFMPIDMLGGKAVLSLIENPLFQAISIYFGLRMTWLWRISLSH